MLCQLIPLQTWIEQEIGQSVIKLTPFKVCFLSLKKVLFPILSNTRVKRGERELTFSDKLGLAFFTIILTFLVNILFKWLQNKFDFVVDTKKFKREHYYKQLNELYFEIYSIIVQSEFLRTFYWIEEFRSLKEVPFLEIQNKLKKYKSNLFTGETLEESEEIVESTITKFNKIGLVDHIIENKKYASQDLLKLAVGYRYVHKHYQNENYPQIQLERFQKKELEMIYKIVSIVVVEFNEKLKFCNMDYNKTEMKKGVMDNGIFEVEK